MVLGSLGLTFLVFAAQPSGSSGRVGVEPKPVINEPYARGPVTHARASAATQETVAPVRLRIPTIDVAARIVRLGLNPDQTVEVPSRPMDSGWYQFGPTPGKPGSAVILGHVDSAAGPAVFARLRHLRRGDLVQVEGADGAISSFRVKRVATYPNASFPAEKVYAAPDAVRGLNLVTCGGEYDAESGYQANVVVYTELNRMR